MDCSVDIGVYISPAVKYVKQNTNLLQRKTKHFFDVGNCKQLETMELTVHPDMVEWYHWKVLLRFSFSSKMCGEEKLNI